ncbi:MAG: RNase P subunit p30 family protein [Candidatus Helarchaeota archaeon]
MTDFYDLHLHGWKNFEEMIPLLERFNYKHVAIVNVHRHELQKTETDSLKLYSRVNLKSNDINELKRLISKNINKYDIISVKSNDKSTFNWAIQDTRVDLLTFHNELNFSIFTREAARLCVKHDKPIEIIISPFLHYYGLKRSKYMRLLSKLIKVLEKSKAPFIISSNARKKWGLRAPKDMARILNLVNFPYIKSIHGVSTHPERIIQRNQINRLKFQNEDFYLIDEINQSG